VSSIAVRVPAEALRPGHVLADGGQVTSTATRHPSGRTVVEIDWACLRGWPTGTLVEVYATEDHR
jgi:hypothetical protein